MLEDPVVKGYLARAPPPPPAAREWICGNCHAVNFDWEPALRQLRCIRSLSWTRPARERMAMRPERKCCRFIVGNPEPKAEVGRGGGDGGA